MKRFFSLLMLLVLVSSISCKKDFLDVPDKTIILRQVYVNDLKTTGDFLNGIYAELETIFYTGNTHLYSDIVADNIKSSSPLFLGVPYTWSQVPNEDQPGSLVRNAVNSNGIWFSGYRIVRNSSFVINEIEKYRSEDPAKADLIKGQAYALRAFAHFILVNIFAQSYNFTAGATHTGIPYITDPDYRTLVSRQTVGEDYDKLITDLKNAIQLLPAGLTDSRLMSQPAVKALLARVYLFKQDYQLAKNLAGEVAGQYPLQTIANDYPMGLFKKFVVGKSESLFQLAPSDPAVTSTGSNYQTTFANLYYPLKVLRASADIGKILKENSQDARSAWVAQVGTDYNITKYPTDVITGFSNPNLSYYETLIRSSEMYLTAAECYANLNNEDSARYYLNAIRLRANTSASIVLANGAALKDSIYKERRKELAFEGLRLYDLQRWKKDIVRSDPGYPTATLLTYPNNKAIAPLPGQDVRLGGLAQNPGY